MEQETDMNEPTHTLPTGWRLEARGPTEHEPRASLALYAPTGHVAAIYCGRSIVADTIAMLARDIEAAKAAAASRRRG